MKNETKSMVIYLIAGIVMGGISFYIKNSLYSLVLAVAALAGIYYLLKKTLKINEKFKWFLSNGGWIYIFIWFISWTIFINVI